MGKLSKVDLEIAEYYAPKLFEAAIKGESSICVWFPGGGKTTIIRDIVSNKQVLKDTLKNLYKITKVIPVFLNEIEEEPSELILTISQQLSANNEQLFDKIEKITNEGNEIILVVDGLELYTEKQVEKLLETLSKIVQANRRRIHTTINTFDKSLIEKFLTKDPSLYCLENNISYMPLIEGNLLEKYIKEKSILLNRKPDKKLLSKISRYTGGILFLTKEILRNAEEHPLFLNKLQAVWMRTPEVYKQIILQQKPNSQTLRTAKNEHNLLGVTKLKVFKQNRFYLEKDSEKLLKRVLSEKEKQIYNFIRKNKGKVVTKDKVATLLWGNESADKYSDWAIDKHLSRIRKTLIKCGFPEDCIRTIKGKGYKWQI